MMDTIRGRLTLYYSLALTLTIGLFSVVMYADQRQAAENDQRSTIEKRLADDAEYATEYLRIKWQLDSARPGDTTLPNGDKVPRTPSLTRQLPILGGGTGRTLNAETQDFLKGMRSWMLIADREGNDLFVSDSLVKLDMTGLLQVKALVQPRPFARKTGRASFSAVEPDYYYRVVPITTSDTAITTLLVVARPSSELLGPKELLRSMALVAPLILAASAFLGYWLAGRSLRPLDVMIQELEGVQDGTSLHRRLAVPAGQDELSRMARTLNAMLGRVEQSFVALRRFTADASHELKTPLMVLRAGVERSLTHPQSPPDVVAALDETLGQVNRMAELVGNLLTLARADEGRASLVLEDHDLRALVVDVWETAELLGEEHGMAAVTLEAPPRPVRVSIDPPRIRELLLNLVTNAIKYTPAGGSVAMRLLDRGTTVVMEVEDNGIGIAAGDIPNIFERFWRADQARTRGGDRPGTGLGLAISKWITEAHGGTIQVRSRPGRGSTFTIILPKTAEAAIPVSGSDGTE